MKENLILCEDFLVPGAVNKNRKTVAVSYRQADGKGNVLQKSG